MLIKFPNGDILNTRHFKLFSTTGVELRFKPADANAPSYNYKCNSSEEAEKFLDYILDSYENKKSVIYLK